MLDQNTDRNIWMIGAVVVGVALIILARTTFKAVFTQIANFLKQMVADTTGTWNGGKATALFQLSTVDWGSVAQQASTIILK